MISQAAQKYRLSYSKAKEVVKDYKLENRKGVIGERRARKIESEKNEK